MSNGLLFLESAENVGTTVTVVLPTVEPIDENEEVIHAGEDEVSLQTAITSETNETEEKDE